MSNSGSKSFESPFMEQTVEEDRTKQISRLYLESKKKGEWRGPDLQRIADYLDISEAKVRCQLRNSHSWGWGKTCVTERGEVVRSDLERQVADFLYQEGIRYVYEPNISKQYTPDFILDDGIAIEVWGVKEHRDYIHNRALKEKWYANSAWGLVSLEPSDVDRLNEIFPIKSREANIVKYSSRGQATLWGISSTSLSTSESDSRSTQQETSERIVSQNSRQMMLDGRPKQAVVSDFGADGPWWETDEEFSRPNLG